MTIKDYLLNNKLEVYRTSAGDTVKSIISIIYRSYSPRLFDLLFAVNGSFNGWEFHTVIENGVTKKLYSVAPNTLIYYIKPNDINLITEIL